MAGFKTHVTFSSLLGCGYAGVGYWMYDMEPATAVLGGALCGFSGMLPDLDSDYGVPLRETMAFSAATIPMLLFHRFAALGLSHDEMVLLGVSLYLFVRFGVTNIIRKYTVHRGMFHSIPAGLTFAGLAFLLAGGASLEVREFKAGGVLLGFMSHLLLDEIYSVEWKGGRWRFKKSFGTAIKLWGGSTWANLSCYAKLAIVVVMILNESAVMQQLERRNPEFARRYQELYGRFEDIGALSERAADAARNFAGPLAPSENESSGSFAPRAFRAAQLGPNGGLSEPPPVEPSANPGELDPFYVPPGGSSEAVIRRDYDAGEHAY
jgi:membrane-bound metal-dependent hydrolase YbcI (DUF457 family)